MYVDIVISNVLIWIKKIFWFCDVRFASSQILSCIHGAHYTNFASYLWCTFYVTRNNTQYTNLVSMIHNVDIWYPWHAIRMYNIHGEWYLQVLCVSKICNIYVMCTLNTLYTQWNINWYTMFVSEEQLCRLVCGRTDEISFDHGQK